MHRTKPVGTLCAAMLVAGAISGRAAELPRIGAAAPALGLPAADGGTRALAGADHPTVLIFFRGLW